jgi:trehalose/maltose transport system substrate-binding protein
MVVFGGVMKKRFVIPALALGTVSVFGVLPMIQAQSGGVEIALSCDANDAAVPLCTQAAQAWAKKTGNTVKIIETPPPTNERLALYQQNLAAGSSAIDVYMIDVIHPGILGGFMIDLKPYYTDAELKQYFPRIVANNTLGGKLTSIPFFTDAGLLYYRTDLLKKYGYKTAPATWQELVAMGNKIQAGERKAGKKNFYGFVYQGNAYEGLTCDALEWIFSFGGGTIVDANGNVTINNAKAAAALDFFGKDVKKIVPAGVTGYGEEDSRGVWQTGNAAFMRNWPYAYSLGNNKDKNGKAPVIAGKFDVVPLPKGGAAGQNAGTLGGWQLAVSKFSKHPKEAVDLLKYLAGKEVQKDRAIRGSLLPTIESLYTDKDVLKANPFFGKLRNVFTNAVARPSTPTATKYNQVSTAFWNGVHDVLTGKANGKTAVANIEKQLTEIKGPGW